MRCQRDRRAHRLDAVARMILSAVRMNDSVTGFVSMLCESHNVNGRGSDLGFEFAGEGIGILVLEGMKLRRPR